MPKGKAAKGKKVTLKMAKKAVWVTPDGRRRLSLSNMGIATFPKCLLKLTGVDELDLSRNLIQKLPDDIGNFLSLSWLDLHSNKLEAVPESIGKLVGLTHLNLSNNRLTSGGLPSTLGSLARLKSLNLGLNRLDALPPTMVALTGLQELGLFDNLFIKLPEFVNVLSSLTKLNTKRNPLSYAQGDGGEMAEPEEDMCKEERERQKRMMRGGGVFEEKRKRTYSGLITPNSVAKTNQDVWRIGQKH
ncbi:leucine-rich repeat-containing protein 18 [Centroberyx gerrardi]|uniref:leucine-rich repeat-containing protein 18 n=1 Tax=Centroberyx gerrardi TaxID=166262 RepID=UPI003AAE9BFE